MYLLPIQTLLPEIKHKAMQATLLHLCVGAAAGVDVNVVIFTIFRAIRVKVTVTRKSHSSLCLLPSLMHLNLKPFGTGVLHLIQINHQPDATVFQFIILTFVYSSVCFGRFPTHH